jgi:threonine synthase
VVWCSGAAPIFHNRVIESPDTIASAIRIGNPASWKQARAAIEESNGAIDVVTDEQILDAQTWLARREGVFVEPASAASIAGLFKCCEATSAACSFKKIPEGSRIVCTVTGHGLKDPDAVRDKIDTFHPVEAKIDNVRRALGF